MTWGEKTGGGDYSNLMAALIGVDRIFSTCMAFAATVKAGTVITWGFIYHGGGCSIV